MSSVTDDGRLILLVVVQSEDGRKDPRVIVESEDQPNRILLETRIQREDGFQKQQGKFLKKSHLTCGKRILTRQQILSLCGRSQAVGQIWPSASRKRMVVP